MGEAGARPVRLDSLTALRFPAALAVVVVHAQWVLSKGAVERLVHPLNAAVTVFFVLSGMVITWGCSDLRPATFYRRRIARIWPLYLLTCAAPLFTSWDYTNWAGSITLTQCWTMHANPCQVINYPAWSLSVEVLFYAFFPVVARWVTWPPRRLATVGGVLCACSGLGAIWLAPFDRWAVLRMGEFLVGVAIARHLRGEVTVTPVVRRLGVVSGVALGVTCLGSLVYGSAIQAATSGMIALPFAAWIVTGLAVRDLRGATTPPLLIRAGELGLSLFVTHAVVIELVRQAGGSGQAWAWATTALTVPIGWVAHHAIEKPCERWLRGANRSSGTSPEASRAPAAAPSR